MPDQKFPAKPVQNVVSFCLSNICLQVRHAPKDTVLVTVQISCKSSIGEHYA